MNTYIYINIRILTYTYLRIHSHIYIYMGTAAANHVGNSERQALKLIHAEHTLRTYTLHTNTCTLGQLLLIITEAARCKPLNAHTHIHTYTYICTGG